MGELYAIENRWIHFLIRAALSPRALHRIGWASTRGGFPHMHVHVDESSDASVARLEAHLSARHDRSTEAVRVEHGARTLDDELP